MLGTNEVCVECNPLGINEWLSKWIKDQPVLVLEDNIIDGDELLTTEGSTESISDGTRLDNSGGKPGGFPVGKYDGSTLGFYDSAMLGVVDSSKLGEKLCCK